MWWRRWRRRLPVAVTWTRPTTEDQRMQEEELGWNGETRSNVRAGPSGIRSVPSAPEAPLEAAFRCQQKVRPYLKCVWRRRRRKDEDEVSC